MRAESAGTDPTDALNPIVVTALAECGITLAGVVPKAISIELLANADLVITMSRHSNGPSLPDIAIDQQHWQLDFPGDDLEAMRIFATKSTGACRLCLPTFPPPIQTAVRAAVRHSRQPWRIQRASLAPAAA